MFVASRTVVLSEPHVLVLLLDVPEHVEVDVLRLNVCLAAMNVVAWLSVHFFVVLTHRWRFVGIYSIVISMFFSELESKLVSVYG